MKRNEELIGRPGMNKNNNVVAGIVTYNPELNRLKENIEHIISQVGEIIIFDNGSTNSNEIEGVAQSYKNRVVVEKSTKNRGIAYALNRLCEWSIKNKYEYMITLDQDSVCPAYMIDTLMGCMTENVAVTAPNIVYRHNEAFALHKTGMEDVDWVITSASLTKLKAWNKVGGFDEALFIDGVDRDFCIRLRRAGYRIIKSYDSELIHELGKLKCRKICGRTIYVTNHSPLRKYYMTRNVIYLDRKLKENRRFSSIGKNLIKTILYEDNKIKKIEAICDGIKDGMKMRSIYITKKSME